MIIGLLIGRLICWIFLVFNPNWPAAGPSQTMALTCTGPFYGTAQAKKTMAAWDSLETYDQVNDWDTR